MSNQQRRSGSDVVAELERQFGQPEPDESAWRLLYTPDDAERYAAEVRDLDAQLDEQWPGWRQRQPFHTLPVAKVAWIKERLKRRDLIITGKGAWGVRVVMKDGYPFAVPVKPLRVSAADLSAYRPIVSVPLLARQFRLAAAVVQQHLDQMPADVRDVRGWLAQRLGHGQAAGAVAPLPEAASPPVSLTSEVG